MATQKAWDRRPDESAQAYEAFTEYLTQPATERSQEDVGRELGKSRALMSRWSAAHEWVERARSFDAENERRAMAAEQRRAVERVERMRARHRRLGRKAIELAMDGLDNEKLAATMTLADVYRLMRGGLLLEKSGFETAIPNSVATSGDLTDPMKQGNAAANQPVQTMLRKLEIEVIGAGGAIVPASEIAAAMAKFYDTPGEGSK